MRNLFMMLCMAVFITACGDDEQSKPQSAAPAATSGSADMSTAESEPKASSSGVFKMIDGIMIVDHTRDEKEFKLKRSIGGVESMIKSNMEQGLDTAELEAQLDELKQKLKDLLAG